MRPSQEPQAALVVALLLAAAACLVLARACEVDAQDRPVVLTDALIAGRVCVKEEFLLPARGQTTAEHDESFRDGCSCIVATLRGQARRSHRTFSTEARLYSPRAFVPGGANPWVAQLVWGENMPPSWPIEHSPWEPHRGRPSGMTEWRRARQVAEGVLSGRIALAAPIVPDHWGAQWFTDRPIREGWERIPCGHALNAFWRVPRRL
jgi:hypothetical protein